MFLPASRKRSESDSRWFINRYFLLVNRQHNRVLCSFSRYVLLPLRLLHRGSPLSVFEGADCLWEGSQHPLFGFRDAKSGARGPEAAQIGGVH